MKESIAQDASRLGSLNDQLTSLEKGDRERVFGKRERGEGDTGAGEREGTLNIPDRSRVSLDTVD